MDTSWIKAARRGALLLMVALIATLLLPGCAAPAAQNPGGDRGGDQTAARGDRGENGDRRVSSGRRKRKGRRKRRQQPQGDQTAQREGAREGQTGTREGQTGERTGEEPQQLSGPRENVPLPPERPPDLGRETPPNDPSEGGTRDLGTGERVRDPGTGEPLYPPVGGGEQRAEEPIQDAGTPTGGDTRVAGNEFPPAEAEPTEQA